jgi:hypothetical protein
MSSLKDLASLIMVPSLYKDGELHTVKPLGNSILHPDATGNHDGTDGSTPSEGNFTFSRGSNLAATRVDVNGLIEKGRENLLLQSNQFDTTWDNQLGVGGSITGGQAGYDGTNNAWLIEKDNTSYRRIQQSVSTSGVFTYSVYAKAGTTSIFNLRVVSASSERVEFDLSNGTIVFNQNEIDAKIESVGNGWYRCSITRNEAITLVQIYVEWNETIGGKNIYIQDAQLEAGLVATDYIETGASTAQEGILEDMPRLDYSGGGSCPALLLEPQRTNVITQSEYFESWNNNDILFDFGYSAPDGTNSAYKITKNGTQAYLYLTGISAADDSRSIYARTTSGTGQVNLTSHNSNSNSLFTITEEWQRFEVTSTPLISSNYYAVDFRSGNLDEVILWGAQLESASYPTSYIPTYGSSVTRSVDTFKVTGISDLIDTQGGVMLLETQALDRNQGYSGVSLSDDTFTNNAQIRYGSATDQVQVQYRVGSSNQCLASNSENDITNNLKIAFKYEADSFKMFVNGVLEATDTSGSVNAANTFDTIKSDRGDGGDKYLGRIKQLVVFPTALTDSECIALTTL